MWFDLATRRRRIPLKAKFVLLLAGFVLAISAVITMNFRAARSIEVDLSAVGKSEFPRYSSASSLLMHYERITSNFENALQTGERGLLPGNDFERDKFLERLGELAAVTPEAERYELEQLRTKFVAYYDSRRRVTEALLSSSAPLEELAARYRPFIVDVSVQEKLVRGAVTDLEQGRRSSLRSVLDEITATSRKQVYGGLAIGVTASLLLIFFAWHTARRIVVPITALSGVTAAVAQGDFDRSAAGIDHLGNDEVADLARSFDAMTRGLRETTVSRDYVDSIIESMADTLVVIDGDENIKTVNRATLDLLGYREDELIGKPATLIFPDADSLLALAVRRTLSGSVIRNAEKEYVVKDGRRIPVSLSGSIHFGVGGGMLGYVCLAQDMTERKKAEEALRRANAELAVARDQALAANETKSQFLANMSHELRTPLNAIIGYSEMLQEDATDLGEEGFVSDLKKIHSAGKHLLALINDILDLSKIEAGKMQLFLEDFEVAPVIREVASMVQPLVQKNSNELQLQYPENLGSIHADMTRVRQVLFNLLSNASKFTRQGVVLLNVQREWSGGEDWMRFTVRDTGIGMTPDQVAMLFQPFTQAEAGTTRKYGGTGLGLTISKYFCTRMNGELTVASEYGVGTTFTASIPVHVVERRDDVPEQHTDASSIRTAPGNVPADAAALAGSAR